VRALGEGAVLQLKVGPEGGDRVNMVEHILHEGGSAGLGWHHATHAHAQAYTRDLTRVVLW
jgi:hypothetical protein